VDVAISSADIRKDMLENSRMYMIRAMEEIRKLSKTLLPPSLGDISLQEAVNDIIENISEVNKLHFVLHWDNVEEYLLNDKLKLAIFRIIQEQFNNIIKHANAKNVAVSLRQRPASLHLGIKDDGAGFDTTAKRKGVGLRNIMSRTSLFNGELLIHSSPGEGCELLIKFNTSSETGKK
jgi:two-component system sensor histidine kinase UhpB